MRSPSRVVKFGGSLLDWPESLASFRRWHGGLPPAKTWLVVGGGATVDRLRIAQHPWRLDDQQTHWLALRGMRQNAWAMAAFLDLARPLSTWESIHEVAAEHRRPMHGEIDPIVLVDVLALLERDPQPLPATWDITSDSLAAWLAVSLRCDSLVLLKSAIPGDRADAGEIEAFVDPQFWRYAQGIPEVQLVNLRDQGFPSYACRRGL
jgi:5-(aminomethyl)-3-furanmethanol phosphate kinase